MSVDYKEIPISQNKFAIVDEDDYDWLNQWKWQLGVAGYAIRGEYIGNYKSITIHMHRLIMNTPKGMCTDHINRERLDNRKCNLRIATRSQNCFNKGKFKGASKYKGVSLFKRLNLWSAEIWKDNKKYWLGNFLTQEEAALAYNNASIKLHGEFAYQNEIAA